MWDGKEVGDGWYEGEEDESGECGAAARPPRPFLTRLAGRTRSLSRRKRVTASENSRYVWGRRAGSRSGRFDQKRQR